MRNRRVRGGIDSRTDFGSALSDEELARRLQAEEFNPGERQISLTPRPLPSGVPSQVFLEEERARTRNANLQRQKAEESLKSQKARTAMLESAIAFHPKVPTFSIPLYSDSRFDRLYSWSMEQIPEFEYVRQVRLRRLIEDLIRRRLSIGEPEYMLKDEIKRLIYESIHEAQKPAKKKAAPRKKKAASKKKASKKKRLTTR